MRLIDADALQKHIEDVFRSITPDRFDTEYVREQKEAFCRGLETFSEMVSGQPTASGWTPCSERLPEKPPLDDIRMYIVQEAGAKPRAAWWDGEKWTDLWSALGDVIAWMPMPEPYKESQE